MTDPQTDRLEYRTLRPPRGETKKEAEDPESALNDCAEVGWELVETIDYTGGGTKFLVLARPVESGSDGHVDEPDGEATLDRDDASDRDATADREGTSDHTEESP